MMRQPILHELTPAPDAWDTARRLAHLPHLLFLDSAGGPAELARFSYVAADPVRWLSSRGTSGESPFDQLKRELTAWQAFPLPISPQFQGGAAGLFGYDLCHRLERLPRPMRDEFQAPDFAVGVYDWVIAWDHQHNRAWIISTGYPETDEPARRARAADRLESVLAQPDRVALIPSVVHAPARPGVPSLSHVIRDSPRVYSNFDRARYVAAVRRVVEYTHAGDCFQVNLSQRLLAPLTCSPLNLYGRLRERNPAPFAGYFDMGEFQIASASPERFLEVANGVVHTRPIKGTRPRGDTPEDDRRQAAELLASPKDRAENVMIVDLMRNDIGRVCKYGSVTVLALCRLESYRTVHHLVSEIQGFLRPEMTTVDLLQAAFPGGSVTGAPKVRAMEIIAELEPSARGPYCGSLGWFGFGGHSMDTNILIRTFTAGRGWIQFPVGGGIVADSDPEREYEETMHKAEGLLRALE